MVPKNGDSFTKRTKAHTFFLNKFHLEFKWKKNCEHNSSNKPFSISNPSNIQSLFHMP